MNDIVLQLKDILKRNVTVETVKDMQQYTDIQYKINLISKNNGLYVNRIISWSGTDFSFKRIL